MLIEGTTGDDTIASTTANDTINAGEGTDTVTFTGNATDYTFHMVDGALQVTDTRQAGDGVDLLSGVESLQFADETLAADAVTLTNSAPTDLALSANTVAETVATGTVVGDLSATDADGDALVWRLTSNGSGKFAVTVGEDGVARVTVAGALNFETAPSYTITAEADDGNGGVVTQNFTINVTDVDEAPTGLKLTSPHGASITNIAVPENAVAGTVIANLAATDPEGGAVSYALDDDAGGLFAIVGTQLVLTRRMDDFETAENLLTPVTVTASDAQGNVATSTFTLRHADAYDAPEGRLTIDATGAAGDMDLTAFITDWYAGATRSSTFFGGTASATPYGPQIATGEQVVVTLSEGGVATDKRVVIEAAEGENLAYDSFASGSSFGHGISGALESVIFGNWVEGVTSGQAGIGDAGLLTGLSEQLKISGFDLSAVAGSGHAAATNLVYAIYRFVTQGDAASLTAALGNYAQDYLGAEGADSFTGGAYDDSISGNAGDDLLAGGAGDDTIDGGEGDDVAVFSGNLADYDVIVNDDGSLTLTDTREAGEGTDTIREIETVRFADGDVAAVDLIPEPPEPPVGTITIDAGNATSGINFEQMIRGAWVDGGEAATTSTVGEDKFFTYENGNWVSFTGTVNYYFARHTMTGTVDSVSYGITGAEGAELTITGLAFANGQPATNEEELEIETNGAVHNFYTGHYNMDGGDFDLIRLNRYADQLDAYAQNFIGSDFADTYTGTAFDDTMQGNGGDDTLDGGDGVDVVVYGGNFAMGPGSDYSFTVNGDGSITLTDLRESGDGSDTLRNVEILRFANLSYNLTTHEVSTAPTDLALSASMVAEDAATGTLVGLLSASDAEGDALEYSLTDDADGLFALEEVDGETRLVVAGALDFETADSHEVTVTVDDGSGNLGEKTFTIDVADVNEAPVITSNGGAASVTLSRAENVKTIATFAATDPDAGATKTWSISGGADRALFTINATTGALAFKAAPDFEAPTDAGRNNTYDVVVKVSDGTFSDTQAVAVKVTDVKGLTQVGTAAANRLTGGLEADTIDGKAGNDVLKGGAGNDRLIGGLGADDLYGEAGADVFLFKSVAESTVAKAGQDTIFDFSGASGDRIDLSAIDANTKLAGNQAFSFIGTKGFSGKAGELRYDKLASDTMILADLNGDKRADFALHLDDALAMQKGWFVL